MRLTRLLNLFVALILAQSVVACAPPTTTKTSTDGQLASATAVAATTTPTAPPQTLVLPTPTATPRPRVPERSEVDVLWVQTGPAGAKGGTSRIKVTIEPNSSRELRVGFYEEEVGGSGPMWHASGWMAVIMSSFLLGIDPVDYRYTFDVGGTIDGPSAGGLMTVATIASLLAHKVKANATMTGTINPDGTIGPVGGIPHKIDGAAAKGKTLVLVPSGSRLSRDVNTKTQVDVVQRGRRQNVDVKEVSDIYEAYELLTGQPLPKPIGMKDQQPSLPPVAYERVQSKAKEWYSRYHQLKTQYAALPKQFRLDLTESLVAEAAQSGEKAEKYHSQGMASAAYGRAVEASLRASMALHTSKVLESYAGGGINSALAYMQSMQAVDLKIDALIDRLQSQKPATLGDSIALADAYGSANLAMALSHLAAATLQTDARTHERAMTVLTMATLYYALADQMVDIAKDTIDIGWGYGSTPAPSEERIASLADLFRRAADANLNYFEKIVLDEIAQEAGIHVDAVKLQFAVQDFDYTFAVSSLKNLPALKQRVSGAQPGSYVTLGGAMNSYMLSSGLVAKYYSLGVKMKKEGGISGVENERAMINMLDFAERRARETIGLASSLGAEPVQPVLYFEDGKARREGDVQTKLSALNSFWGAAMQAQAIAMLSGKARTVSP